MTVRPMAFLSVSLVGAGLAGCSKDPVICTMEARPALAVVVVDSITGAGLAGTALVLAREGGVTDTLAGSDSVVSGVFERAGTYRVEVSSPGYRPWSREGVLATGDECHVQTVRLRALLVPE